VRRSTNEALWSDEEATMIPNPNAPKTTLPVLEPEARTKLAKALDEIIRGWLATDDTGVPITHIAERELVARLRRQLPAGVDAEAIDVEAIRAVLGHRDKEDG
jgi:hypothetical protein